MCNQMHTFREKSFFILPPYKQANVLICKVVQNAAKQSTASCGAVIFIFSAEANTQP